MQIRIRNTAPAAAPIDRGLSITRNTLPLIARVLLSALFLWSGVNKILHPIETQQYMAANGMIWTGFFWLCAIAIELLGGLSVLLGVWPRLGAGVLAGFTAIATLIFHRNFADPVQAIMLMKNLSILGGLLMLVQFGGGNLRLRWPRRR